MNKHTPGPWAIKREHGDINIVSDEVPYVAQVFTCPAVDVNFNAALIAAAPELLAALQLVVGYADETVKGAEWSISASTMNRVLLAIAKATEVS